MVPIEIMWTIMATLLIGFAIMAGVAYGLYKSKETFHDLWKATGRQRDLLHDELAEERAKLAAALSENHRFKEIEAGGYELIASRFGDRKWTDEHPTRPGVYIAVQEVKEAKGISPLITRYEYYIIYLEGQPPVMDAVVYRMGDKRSNKTINKAGTQTTCMDHWTPFIEYVPGKEGE